MKRKYYKCKWCGYEWFSRPGSLKGRDPKVCPVCHYDWRKVKGSKK